MLILDRFESDMAVCECTDKTFVQIDRSLLPEGAKEGDLIKEDTDGKYIIDENETKKSRERIAKKMDALWE